MYRHQLVFDQQQNPKLQSSNIEPPAPDEVLVKSLYSGISSGTELLLIKGGVERRRLTDDYLPPSDSNTSNPSGYANVGKIIAVGSDQYSDLLGRRVFSFSPHQSLSKLSVKNGLLFVPEAIPSKRAIFFANLETAVSLVQDGRPRIGERVAVIGAGIVGQLVSRLLATIAGIELFIVEKNQLRRQALGHLHAHRLSELHDLPNDLQLVFELSGCAALLEPLFERCQQDARLIIGSWYGDQNNQIPLNTTFHRRRLRLISSQVSHINLDTVGFQNKNQRYQLVWRLLETLALEPLISHCQPFTGAAEIFKELLKDPGPFLQVCFDYKGENHVSSGT